MAIFRLNAKPPAPPGVGASCLRNTFPRHPCRACADACPVAAITLSAAGQTIDDASCLRCGNCLFPCPTDAPENLTPTLRNYQADRLVAPFSACITADELLMWHFQYAIRGVALESADHPVWVRVVAELNLTLRQLREPEWQIFPPTPRAVNPLRRHWLHIPEENVQSGRVSAGRRARRALLSSFSEYQFSLSLSLCMACGACARACPENALQITETALAWDPARCTGCNSCTAVCFSAAIRIEHQLQAATPQRYPFAVKTCRSCHHTFYTFSPEADRCHICQRHAFAMREA